MFVYVYVLFGPLRIDAKLVGQRKRLSSPLSAFVSSLFTFLFISHHFLGLAACNNMSLPTPPGTAHREEKENRRLWTARSVSWSDHHEIHNLTAEIPRRIAFSVIQPGKSILKRKPRGELPHMEEIKRETTPEPSDPLTDLHYLDNPVAKIIAADAALRDLIESYSVLAARLRACVSGNVDADASWPLFQPLRKHRDAFVQAMCRDLGRALEVVQEEETTEEDVRALPSPERSPKKRGMSAEGAKYARDLCTTCHAVLKLLSAVFTLPAVLGIFTGK